MSKPSCIILTAICYASTVYASNCKRSIQRSCILNQASRGGPSVFLTNDISMLNVDLKSTTCLCIYSPQMDLQTQKTGEQRGPWQMACTVPQTPSSTWHLDIRAFSKQGSLAITTRQGQRIFIAAYPITPYLTICI
jgi:hypothetical protein